ncbi:MAG: hypothetical protein KJ697_05260 [Nanoarchaeota archaeon]|nr:hypothetical protein [Nanoarchaeota archaeon]MBU4123893.1 hypothetical protein [Nanoarchaeota archaeon]
MEISTGTSAWIDEKMKEYYYILDVIKKINNLGYCLPGEFPISASAEFVKRYVNNVEVAETGLPTVRRDIVLLYFANKRQNGFTREEARKEIDSLGVKYTIYIPNLIKKNEIINKSIATESDVVEVGKEELLEWFNNSSSGIKPHKKPNGIIVEYRITKVGKSNLVTWCENNENSYKILERLNF